MAGRALRVDLLLWRDFLFTMILVVCVVSISAINTFEVFVFSYFQAPFSIPGYDITNPCIFKTKLHVAEQTNVTHPKQIQVTRAMRCALVLPWSSRKAMEGTRLARLDHTVLSLLSACV